MARTGFVPLPGSWRAAAFAAEHSVLLESAAPHLPGSRTFLFQHPVRLLTAAAADDLPQLFAEVEVALHEGLFVAGWFAYECGAHFQGLPQRPAQTPLALLGVFKAPQIFNHAEPHPSQPRSPAPLQPLALLPSLSPGEYTAGVERIQAWIAAGDTYQVNYTMPALSRFAGGSEALYAALLEQQQCAYAAVVRLESRRTILSFSPELFFQVDESGTITTRPMKGTSPRGEDDAQDRKLAHQLRHDEKTLAEHVMIVDLLRNDLGRICETGSVRVPELFTVETYPTVLQMTSKVAGQLKPETTWYEVFSALVPCGSVTGAPKHHTMQLIEQIEPEPRGIYTGAIGYIAPDRTSAFSVAIRTLSIEDGLVTAGTGGGIVADSNPADEYTECLWKLRFATQSSTPLTLFETLRLTGGDFPLLTRHMARMAASAAALGFSWNETSARTLLASVKQRDERRVRLTLARDGSMHIETFDHEPWPEALHLLLADGAVNSRDPALRHKCSFRQQYDDALADARAAGHNEALFRNEHGELTEGCISSLLVRLGDVVYTPPVSAGLLPGVARGLLLARGLIQERTLNLRQIIEADAVYLCNAVRGLAPVKTLTVDGVRHALPVAELRWQLW